MGNFSSLFSILLDSLKLMTNSIPLFSLTCECSKIFAALKICRGCREPEQWPDWPSQTTPGPLSYETSSCSGNFQVGVCLGLKTFDLNYQKRQKIEMKCFFLLQQHSMLICGNSFFLVLDLLYQKSMNNKRLILKMYFVALQLHQFSSSCEIPPRLPRLAGEFCSFAP